MQPGHSLDDASCASDCHSRAASVPDDELSDHMQPSAQAGSLPTSASPFDATQQPTGQSQLLSVTVAPIMMVMGPATAAVLCIYLLQQCCLLELLSLRVMSLPQARAGDAHKQHLIPEQLGLQQPASAQYSCLLTATMLWVLYAAQLFFCTGHLNEFAGLHYSAGMPYPLGINSA